MVVGKSDPQRQFNRITGFVLPDSNHKPSSESGKK